MRGRIDHVRERSLRSQQTKAELLLWQQLRNRRLLGMKFRRQHRIGPFFADFASLQARLVVELDGSQHLARARDDAYRTRYLKTCGFRVLRFWDDAVFNRMDEVIDAIAAALISAPHPPSAPSPRMRGEGISD